MTEQAETGNIGTGGDRIGSHERCRRAVEGRHGGDGCPFRRLGQQAGFDGRGEHARADGFGENQGISRFGPGVGQDALGMHQPGDRQAILEFRILNAVAAHQHRSGGMDLLEPAP